MEYKPGDVANGYVLGSDLAWHPVARSGERTRRGYVRRYFARLPKTLAACAVLWAAVSAFGALAGTLGAPEVLMIMTTGTVFFGIPINLLVALAPERRSGLGAGDGGMA